MLRECHVYKPPTAVVQSTLKWAFADLEEAAMRQTAFSLLKVMCYGQHVQERVSFFSAMSTVLTRPALSTLPSAPMSSAWDSVHTVKSYTVWANIRVTHQVMGRE